jgi:hypothetical protein
MACEILAGMLAGSRHGKFLPGHSCGYSGFMDVVLAWTAAGSVAGIAGVVLVAQMSIAPRVQRA